MSTEDTSVGIKDGTACHLSNKKEGEPFLGSRVVNGDVIVTKK